MSFKNISIPLALICCVFMFNAFDIATFIGKLKVKLAHNQGASSKKNTGREKTALVHSASVRLQSEKELPNTAALNEREPALYGDQSLRPENMTSNNVSFNATDLKDRSGNFYTIEKGDTPDSIATEHGISLRELLLVNKNINSKKLQVGQTLSIPGKDMATVIKIKAYLGKRFLIDESRPTKIAAKDTKKYKNLAEQTSSNNNWDDEISSSFGRRNDPIDDRSKFHQGIDIPRPMGTKVFAWDDGVVTKSGWLRGYGLTVDVVHSNGIKTRYAHLTKVNVRKGQKLNDGQVLGLVGKTGRTTGANLHFEVLLAGKRTDPRRYLSEGLAIVEDIRENG